MNKYFIFGFIFGVFLTLFSMLFSFSRYYVFVGPTEVNVKVDGLAESFRNEQFSEVNEILKNLPGGRRAFIYPTSTSSYSIVYLPKMNKNLDDAERKKIAESISAKMNNCLGNK